MRREKNTSLISCRFMILFCFVLVFKPTLTNIRKYLRTFELKTCLPFCGTVQGGPSSSGNIYVDIKLKVPSLAWVTG